MKENRGHVFYFDYLRIIAALFVVFMHVASGPLRRASGTDWHLLNALTSLSFTAVPLFFMMSGYLLLRSEKTEDIALLFKKRLPKLILPLIFWSVFSVFYRLFLNGTMTAIHVREGLIDALSSPAWVHLWYMYTLIALYILSPFLRAAIANLSRGGHVLLLSIIGVLSLRSMLAALLPSSCDPFLQLDIINKLEFFGGHLATFILGYYLGSLKRRLPNLLLGAGCLLTLLVIIVGTALLSRSFGQYMQDFQRQSAGFEVLLAAGIFLLFKQNSKRETSSPVLSSIVSLTLPIYLIHNFLLFYINKIGFGANTFAEAIRLSLIIFFASAFISKTLATIPGLSFLTAGTSFREATGSCNWVFTFRLLFKRK